MTSQPQIQSAPSAQNTQDEVKQQAGKLLTQFAGYVGFETINIGLRNGLLSALAENIDGLTTAELASAAGTDEFYTGVWARAAYGAELIEIDSEDRYTLAPHMDNLLLNQDFPGYVGGITGVFSQPEIFDNFSHNLKSGKRVWWNDASPTFIEAVMGTGRPFYNRLIPTGLEKVPGLTEKLASGAKVLELASGAGRGLVKIVETYPNSEIVGVDGDEYSVGLATDRVQAEGVADRVIVVHSTLEDFVEADTYDLVFINISMHECRDIDRVTDNVRRSLKPGGHFVISDFPFPSTHEGLRTPAARVLTGIQYFEAQIDDQLVPTAVFVDLLDRHGFNNVTAFDITPVHNLIFGQK
jgi:ubiquinone/menaquinone biosynthesis C-methylase UbiE